jgi:hypothetical protein
MEFCCFLDLDPDERKSVMEKERLGRVEPSGGPADGKKFVVPFSPPVWGSDGEAMTAVMLIGVPGLLR